MSTATSSPMGDLMTLTIDINGKYNATDVLNQWNAKHGDCKTVKGFVDSESAFYAEFFGDRMPLFIFDDNGDLWLDECEFRDFLTYLSPEFFMVEWPCAQMMEQTR